MEDISHIIISRMRFNDKILFREYLKVTKDILVPSLKSQINKNFTWGVVIRKEDIQFTKEYLDLDFLPFSSSAEFVRYAKDNNINIQTRHDMDDYMSDMYVEKIQEAYKENIEKWDMFLIHTQPTIFNYKTKKEYHHSPYHDTRNSMFLSLCQKNSNHHIFERQHGHMYEITDNVIKLPEGYTKWVIHGNNLSCVRRNETVLGLMNEDQLIHIK